MEKRKAKGGLIWARGIITLLFCACVLFIWHNSLESAPVSSARSGRVTEVVNQMLSSLGKEGVTEHFVRKLAHFSEYGVEGVLTVLLYMVYCLKPTRRWRAVLLTGVLTAAVDESIQFFSAGRSPGLGDICLDVAGFICGMLFMLAVYRIMQRGHDPAWPAGDGTGRASCGRV